MAVRQAVAEFRGGGVVVGQLLQDFQGLAVLGLRLGRLSRIHQHHAEEQMAVSESNA